MKYGYPLVLMILIASCVNRQEQEEWLRQIQGEDKILAFIYEEDGKQGLLDTNKQVLLKAQFDYIQDWQIDGLVLVDSGGSPINGGDHVGYEFDKYGIITTTGEVLFRPQFDKAVIGDKAVMVRKDSVWGFVDNKGNWLIEPTYQDASPFYKGTAIVLDKDQLYLINKKKELVNPTPFDSIWGFNNGVTVVEKDNKYGYVHYSGAFILPLDTYSGIGDFNWYHGTFRKDNQWFVIDTTGKLSVEHGFDQVAIVQEKERVYAKGILQGEERKIELK
jgi:hypothetical protein